MEIHPKKVFENAFQIQILRKYTSLVRLCEASGTRFFGLKTVEICVRLWASCLFR